MTNSQRHTASFRDPSGFLFKRQGILYRQINKIYRENYDRLMQSGLYEALVQSELLIPHEEVDIQPAEPDIAFNTIRPQKVAFISYPYEWCFSQLKDAALTTLAIQKLALEYDMSLKDCSAYNIQFRAGKPVLIDTLSFEIYDEGEPWAAYRQFCQHFLAPLALMAFRDVRLSQLMRIYIDGIPLDLASRLLPTRTRLNFTLLTHVHVHASTQQRYADKTIDKKTIKRQMNRMAFLGLVDNLESGVRALEWKLADTEWGDYYEEEINYTPAGIEHKKELVRQFLARIQPANVWDVGGNTGLFSRLASDQGIPTLSFDIDPAAVEQNYRDCRLNGESNLLPLLLDLTNPSPNLGWGNQERRSLLERGPAHTVMALALVHHMAISNNVPLDWLARLFQQMGPWLIVEFIPKSDSQVQRLLATREDIFPHYTQEGFEQAFGKFFNIRASSQIKDSERLLYLMERI
jgi:hypothetical protein